MTVTNRISYKRIAGYTALVLATLTTLFVIYRLGQVVLLFVLSIIVAAALRAPMLWLQARRVPRGSAILLLYLVVLTALSLTLFAIAQPLGGELRLAGERFPQLYDRVARFWEASPQQWQKVIGETLPDSYQIVASIGESGPQIAYQVAGLSYNIANVLISVLAILTLTFYWLVDEDRFMRLWLLLLPVQQRMVARQMWQDIERRVGTFVRSEAVQFLLTLMLLWLGLQALGVQYPTIWALYGAIVQLIPWVGVPLTLLPAIPMFWTDPLPVFAAAVVLIIAVGTLMDRFIEPRLGVQNIVHPIVSVLALMILGEAAGVIGMLVALPLAATLQSVLSRLVHANTTPRPSSLSVYSTQIQDLRARVMKLQADLPQDYEQRRAAEGLILRLDGLLDKTEQVLDSRASAPQRRRMAGKNELRSRIPAIFARHRSR